MKYHISVKLKRNIFATRRSLTKMGFTAFIHNTVSGQWDSTDSDYSKVTTMEDSTTEYYYIYNGNTLPHNILTFLEDNPNISSYTIEKRET